MCLNSFFEIDVPLFTVAILLVMITIAGRTSGKRAVKTPNGVMIAWLAIGIGSALTIALLVVLGVFDFVPHNIIPIGGMIVGTSMTTATLVITRLSSDFYDQRDLIESKLALGATSRQASLTQFQRTITSAMAPIIDTTKTVGLIKLPGAMTGMILAGASPLEAVQLQIIVMYMLVGAATFTGLIAAWLDLSAILHTRCISWCWSESATKIAWTNYLSAFRSNREVPPLSTCVHLSVNDAWLFESGSSISCVDFASDVQLMVG